MNKVKHHKNTIFRAQATAEKGFVPNSLNESTRSVEVIGATQTRAMVYDPSRGEDVTEVLLMSGAKLPDTIPVTVDHWGEIDSVIGSYREMKVENNQLIGRVYFSKAADSEKYWTKVSEGHLGNFSVSYPARERVSTWIAAGESEEIEGTVYDGPILITKSWTPKALGLVVWGADKNAKVRSAEGNPMDKNIRMFLERCGLKKDATDEEVTAFIEREETLPDKKEDPPVEPKIPDVDIDVERASAAAAERERISGITALCDRHKCPELKEKSISNGDSLDVVRGEILDVLAGPHETPRSVKPEDHALDRSRVILDERDKFRAAAEDSLLIRAGVGKIEKPALGADELTGWSLAEIARHSLRVANQGIGGNSYDMIGRAMLTSDFSSLLANVANKSLFEGWGTAEETWQQWVATGTVPDFKTSYMPRVSELDGLDEVAEGVQYKYGKRTDATESYSIATYGKLFAYTRQTLINDDLNALVDMPKARGEAAARKVGDVVYAVLTGNAAMGDGIAVFHADHSNFVDDGSGAAPGIATIAAGILAMKGQKDLQGLRRLNIRPRFLIAPTALEGATEVFFRSERFSDNSTVATDSTFASTRVNPYAGNYFTRIYEPRLDDDDTAAWYLAAAKGKTVKAFFLNGQQKPYLETKEGWSVDGVEYKVRIDVGAKAVDWRGLYFNDGN